MPEAARNSEWRFRSDAIDSERRRIQPVGTHTKQPFGRGFGDRLAGNAIRLDDDAQALGKSKQRIARRIRLHIVHGYGTRHDQQRADLFSRMISLVI
ncbi:TPA: hypothetical protein QDC20_000338 [Burkholderia aenigmatica]|uniref:hypothetical protein n=1 Tax=Burkholderia sp. AU45251 TaxID=3059204 RepID=UPI00264B5FF0|nr:hypothetical protein [Burkholderia sp. AU45251]HDR9483238.1 hypothetical protein [Burkholderia aenigmatica]MDN7516103.1 hypothetical protein [Burkholderia sp. AU45251]HDR9514186.1 hypothetical protein [Burkholderia aenigmatica]HDR9591576.1 hypothetical protein [Burkholderia aenigmatica]HDR9598668.1 hypothetical protein [Burkholderia aenigmatica]